MNVGIASSAAPTPGVARSGVVDAAAKHVQFIHCTGVGPDCRSHAVALRRGPAGPFTLAVRPSIVNCASPSRITSISSDDVVK
jgi:hypothetical protein